MMKRIGMLIVVAMLLHPPVVCAGSDEKQYVETSPEVGQVMENIESTLMCELPGFLPIIGEEWEFNERDNEEKSFYSKTFLLQSGSNVEALDLIVTMDAKTFICQGSKCQKLRLD